MQRAASLNPDLLAEVQECMHERGYRIVRYFLRYQQAHAFVPVIDANESLDESILLSIRFELQSY